MIFPKNNLLYDDNDHLNQELYYKKLADELIRYSKIREYVFNNDTFLNFESLPRSAYSFFSARKCILFSFWHFLHVF